MKFSLIVLFLALPVFGQAPNIPGIQPPVPAPGVPAEKLPDAAKKPGMPDPNALATPRGERFEYPNIDGQTAAFLYHELTGIRVLVSSAAAQAEISIIQPGPLTNREAATLLEKQLLMEGFGLIPSGDNEVKMVISQGNATQSTEGPQLFYSPDELPEGDVYVIYVMPLEYLKPDEAMRAFQQVVGTFGPAGKVAAVPNASSVVISANTPLVRMLIELKNRIDVPSSKVGTKFVGVQFAEVEELSERLNEIFNSQQQASQSARVQRTQAPNPALAAALAASGQGAGAGEDTPINILPDPRTNRIFLMGRPVDIVFVEGLIADFDAPSSKRNFLRRKLRYLPVAEFLPVAENALERIGTGSSAGGSGAARSSGRSGSTTRPGITGRSTNSGNTAQRGGGNTQGGSGSRAELGQQIVQTAPESILVGKTLLVADNISNSIVVQGAPHHVEIIESLLEELDQPSEQIAITAVFGRYDIGKDRSFGIDLANLFQSVTGDLSLAGQLRTGVPSVIDPTTLTDFTTLLGVPGAAGNGMSLYGTIGDDFGVFVNALESNENFSAISRPTVFTTNNHEARISSGSRIAVPTSTYQGGASSGFSTNVEFRDIVLELVVLPLVNDKDEVTLNISLVRDNTGENRFIEGFGNVPDIDTDEIGTTVTVPNRSTIILGGLITEGETDSQTGIPVLSSIPVLGRLFGRTTTETKREELVIMIHPSIIYSRAGLEGYQREYDTGSEISPRARASMEGSGMLPYRGEIEPVSDKDRLVAPVAQPVSPLAPSNPGPVSTSPSQRAVHDKMRHRRRR